MEIRGKIFETCDDPLFHNCRWAVRFIIRPCGKSRG